MHIAKGFSFKKLLVLISTKIPYIFHQRISMRRSDFVMITFLLMIKSNRIKNTFNAIIFHALHALQSVSCFFITFWVMEE